MAPIIASLTTACGPLQMFSLEALELALAKISTMPTQAGTLSDEAPAPLPPSLELLDGFTINQWAAYAKLKSQVASRMCQENGMMKRKLANLDNWRPALPPAAVAEKGDPLFASDPWQAASSKLAAPRSGAASTSASSDVHLWADWSPAVKQHDIPKEPETAHSDVDKGSSCRAVQCCPDQENCSTEGDDFGASGSASGMSVVTRDEPLQLNACEPKVLNTDMQALRQVPNHFFQFQGMVPAPRQGTCLRVVWPSIQELAADDVCDYFEAFGKILELDWLDDDWQTNTETIKLKFETAASVGSALRQHAHNIARESDGKIIAVKVHVKFSDNVIK
jgi:hypothetical protein